MRYCSNSPGYEDKQAVVFYPKEVIKNWTVVYSDVMPNHYVMNWCDEYITGKWTWRMSRKSTQLAFFFSDTKDALLFKLTYTGLS